MCAWCLIDFGQCSVCWGLYCDKCGVAFVSKISENEEFKEVEKYRDVYHEHMKSCKHINCNIDYDDRFSDGESYFTCIECVNKNEKLKSEFKKCTCGQD